MWIHPRLFCLTSYKMKIISIYSIFSHYFFLNSQVEVSKESMPVSTNTDLPSKYPMKSLPENLKFDTANLKFAMSRDQIFLKNCKKIYIWYKQENKYALGSKEIPVVFSFLFLKASLLDAVADLPWIIFMTGPCSIHQTINVINHALLLLLQAQHQV